MKISFKGRKALVTGGARGIGRSIVRHLALAGAEVVTSGRDEKALRLLQENMKEEGLSLEFYIVDFAHSKEVEKFIKKIVATPYDIVVNNAGMNKIAPLEAIDSQEWDLLQQVNVKVPFLICQALAPAMARRGYGRIINMTSIYSQVSRAMRASYASSKFALAGMTRTIALEYAACNVLANSVAPGIIDTDLTRSVLTEGKLEEVIKLVPMGRLGTVDEIARVVLFLASDVNTFLTGQNVFVDGGFTSV